MLLRLRQGGLGRIRCKQRSKIVRLADNDGLGRTRDGIVLAAARNGAQRNGQALQRRRKDLVGIGAALVDLHAAVAAGQTTHADTPCLPLHRNTLDGNGQAGGQDALVLGVDVQQHTALQAAHIESCRAEHADLLVDGEHRLEGRVLQRIGIQHRQRIGHGDAVVSAERRAVGKNIGVVMAQAQAVLRKIDIAVRILLADHVEVTLQDHGGMVLIAGAGRLADDNVVRRILLPAQAALLREADAVVRDRLCVARAMRDGAQRLKKAQRSRRRKSF